MAPLPAVRAAGPVRQPAVPSIILPGMVPVPADYQPLSGDTVHLSVDVAETALREAGSDSSPQVISLSPASPVDASAGAGSAQRPAGAAIASSVSEDSKDQPTTVISLRPVLPSIRERVHGLLAGSVPIPPGTGIAQVAPVISGSFPWEAPPRASSETTIAGASAAGASTSAIHEQEQSATTSTPAASLSISTMPSILASTDRGWASAPSADPESSSSSLAISVPIRGALPIRRLSARAAAGVGAGLGLMLIGASSSSAVLSPAGSGAAGVSARSASEMTGVDSQPVTAQPSPASATATESAVRDQIEQKRAELRLLQA